RAPVGMLTSGDTTLALVAESSLAQTVAKVSQPCVASPMTSPPSDSNLLPAARTASPHVIATDGLAVQAVTHASPAQSAPIPTRAACAHSIVTSGARASGSAGSGSAASAVKVETVAAGRRVKLTVPATANDCGMMPLQVSVNVPVRPPPGDGCI